MGGKVYVERLKPPEYEGRCEKGIDLNARQAENIHNGGILFRRLSIDDINGTLPRTTLVWGHIIATTIAMIECELKVPTFFGLIFYDAHISNAAV